MKIRFLTYFLCVAAAVQAVFGASSYQFRHLPAGMQLSSKLVNVIFQDDDGFIYFGTASGLDRYDGYGVRTYTRDDSDSTALHDSFVEDLQRAPDGRLWVRAGGTYSIYDVRADRFYKDMDAVYASMGLSATPSVLTFDPEGSCWLFVDGEGLYCRREKATVQVADPDSLLLRAPMCELAVAGPGRMLFVDESGCMVFVDTRTARICSTTRVPQFDGNCVFTAYTDREGMIWMFSAEGLWLYSPATNTWHDSLGGTTLPQGDVKAVLQDRLGRMWIGFDHDGLVVIEKNGRMQRIMSDPDDARTISGSTVTTLMEDSTGSIWVGSRKNGVSIYNDSAFKFDFTSFPDVNCILSDKLGRIWLGTDSDGLICWDREGDGSHAVKIAGEAGIPDVIVDIAVDAAGTVWAGTYGGGLLSVGADGRTRTLTSADGLVSDNVWAVYPMDDGTLMLGTLDGGVQRFNPATRASKVYDASNSGLGTNSVNSICKGHDGRLYMGTADGLAVFDLSADKFTLCQGNVAGTQRFYNGNINEVMCDSRGLLWVATREGLNVYDIKADRIYGIPLGGARRFVLGVAEDANHEVWVSIGSELVSVAVSAVPSGGWAFDTHVYDSSDGLQTCDFNQRSLCTLPAGEMMVGGYYGINSFRPDGIKFSASAPRVFFTGLSLFNEEIRVGREYNGRVLLPVRISELDAIELDYSDNEFALSFATDSYVNPDKTVYYYCLDGFNEGWQCLPDNTHRVSYTNLAPGNYTLHVKACSADGAESANEAILGIVIHPPFYATTVAKVLYVLLAAAVVFAAFIFVRNRERRLSLRREQQEAARKQEELDQLKFRFFTNVSHELRTPLTLITAPLESLLKQPMEKSTRDKLEMIYGNATRLLLMVNQLLDFRKHEVTGLTLNLSRGDIVAFTRSICDSFLMLSEKKHIHLTFFSSEESLEIDFDEDKMEKIIMNLLSNAYKFTPDTGRVDVSLSLAGEMLELTIADTGCGVSDEDKKHIFERFYQASDSQTAGIGGTGIGLSLVAEFVRLHGGTVSVADNAVRGAVFTVTLPVRGAEGATDRKARPVEGACAPSTGASMPRLLMVDDNADVLRFISSELSGEYAVVTVGDGAEALEEISRYKPDIIMSDLMMPGMNGIELCRRLKSDPNTASIPLLILTAKHDVSAKIEGLTIGADDYVTKPFNIDVLRLRLAKLLSLHGRGARRAVIEPEPQSIAITSLDEKLIERAVRYVDENMSRSDLSVEELATELGMSRVHLYKRLKQITGKTPIEFIRVLRLKRAAQLLRESQLNISEIAYRCGFNNPKYFSKYFKEEFGVLPSVYQEKEGK